MKGIIEKIIMINMKLKTYKPEEVETMTYDELAYAILNETGKKEKILTLFQKICKLQNLDFERESEKITDFFEILTTNKKFIMLDKGYWDLQKNHKLELDKEDIEDNERELLPEEIKQELSEVVSLVDNDDLDNEKEEEEDIFFDDEDVDDIEEDDLSDLSIIDDNEETV